MTTGETTSVVLIALAAALAPLLADQLKRWIAIPSVVLEIGLGVLIGPAALGLAEADQVVDALANIGLVLLFFLGGYDLDLPKVRGMLARAFGSWVGSLVLALAAGGLLALLLGRDGVTAVVIGLALSATALGVTLPILRDAGALGTRFGVTTVAVGAVGEFAPVIAVALMLGRYRPAHATALLLGFAAVAAVAVWLALRRPPEPVGRLLSGTLTTSEQFAVRLCVLAVLGLVWVATELHLDLVLGAFAAGIVVRLVLGSLDRREAEIVESKLDGIGFGMLVPFFFVTTGLRFDLPSLVADPTALLLVPVGLALLLVVRGLPVVLAYRRRLPRPETGRLALYTATSLPMVVVVTATGVERGHLDSGTAAGLVGAAVLSVLVFPTTAGRLGMAGTPQRSGPGPTPAAE